MSGGGECAHACVRTHMNMWSKCESLCGAYYPCAHRGHSSWTVPCPSLLLQPGPPALSQATLRPHGDRRRNASLQPLEARPPGDGAVTLERSTHPAGQTPATYLNRDSTMCLRAPPSGPVSRKEHALSVLQALAPCSRTSRESLKDRFHMHRSDSKLVSLLDGVPSMSPKLLPLPFSDTDSRFRGLPLGPMGSGLPWAGPLSSQGSEPDLQEEVRFRVARSFGASFGRYQRNKSTLRRKTNLERQPHDRVLSQGPAFRPAKHPG